MVKAPSSRAHQSDGRHSIRRWQAFPTLVLGKLLGAQAEGLYKSSRRS